MAKIDRFIQRTPSDGEPVTQRTEAYLGYDNKNLYVIYVCFDSEPHRIRARLSRREQLLDDDNVELMLDTFHDHRRAYAFFSNPLGIQGDALWTEGQDFDFSFDTVFRTEGKLTKEGFVIEMAIPFRSLRFASNDPQTWGIMLNRYIQRDNEGAFWPQNSSRISGRLNQEGDATGLENISPGHNFQLIPYGIFRSYRDLDLRDPDLPRFTQRDAFGQIGLDAKAVLKDKFVLDATANPDFSQI
ncbi:MAG: carbohydrate binding family 9 domain-containing protein [Terriglobales bacterium]